ncbi:MAG: ester cyclase [Chloroflexia bacterium]
MPQVGPPSLLFVHQSSQNPLTTIQAACIYCTGALRIWQGLTAIGQRDYRAIGRGIARTWRSRHRDGQQGALPALHRDRLARAQPGGCARLHRRRYHRSRRAAGAGCGAGGADRDLRMFLDAFPDAHIDIEDLLADGDKIVARIVLRGTHQGPFFGIPATGRPVVVPGIHLMRYADGKMTEHWSNSDDLGMMGQLGVIPPLG